MAAPAQMRSTQLSEPETEQLLADLADTVHRGSRHGGETCHGNNDGCAGGPDPVDYDLAEDALSYVLSELGMRRAS